MHSIETHIHNNNTVKITKNIAKLATTKTYNKIFYIIRNKR